MKRRRDFLAQLAAGAAALTFDADELRAASTAITSGAWDTSWLDRLAAAKYRVVFNVSEISDGAALDYSSTFFDHYHEVHGTSDGDTRPVLVIRRLGTQLGFNDAMWNKYEIGADTKTNDPLTHAPARRNIYWSGSDPKAITIESLQKRGMISLVCNIALGNVGTRFAERTKQDVETVRAELRANLVPGAILVPSGIYALIRAQNAGCAYMPGT
jgi:intracellular sulfur oxidation DsrE/DsrF family protein